MRGGNINDDYHNLLYISNGNKDNLAFTECAALSDWMMTDIPHRQNFFDYDRDGDLDMYLVTAAMIIPNKNAIRPRKNDGSMINTDGYTGMMVLIQKLNCLFSIMFQKKQALPGTDLDWGSAFVI